MWTTFLIVLVLYFALMLAVNVWGFRRTHTEADFLVAGRTIGPLVGGAVLAATQMSAGTYVGTMGRHYLTGASWYLIWLGMWMGWLVSAFFIAPKLRQFGALTVPDYIAARFNSDMLRVLTGALIVVVYVIYLVAQFQASGEIAQGAFGLHPLVGMIVIIAATCILSLLGGVLGSSYMQFIQALIMVGGLVVGIPLLVSMVGGFPAAWRFLSDLDPRLTGMYYSWHQLLGFSLAFCFSIASAPYEMTRFYSMRDVRTVKQAIAVCIFFQFLIGGAVLICGMLMRVVFPNLTSADQASTILAFQVLPPLAGSLLLLAMISAILSTCNSILLVAGAGFAHDIYARVIRPNSSDSHLILVNRATLVVLSVIPAFFALQKYGDVQGTVIVKAKLVGSFFFIPILLGLNWRGGTAAGAMSAMLGGFFSCLFWELKYQQYSATWGIDSVEVGVLTSLILFVAVSKFTKPVPEENLKVFFK